MIGGKRATRGPQSFSCVVGSMKKIQTNLDRIRSSSRNSRPGVLGSRVRAESRTGAPTWRTLGRELREEGESNRGHSANDPAGSRTGMIGGEKRHSWPPKFLLSAS